MVQSVFTKEGDNCLSSTDLSAPTYSFTFLSMKKGGEGGGEM